MRRRRMEEHERDHIRLLSICYRILAGVTALGSLVPLIFMVLTLLLLVGPGESSGGGPFVLALQLLCVVVGLAFASCLALTASYLSGRRHRTFCLIAAGIACLLVPFGTILGVFTIVVLTKDSARAQFRASVLGSSTS